VCGDQDRRFLIEITEQQAEQIFKGSGFTYSMTISASAGWECFDYVTWESTVTHTISGSASGSGEWVRGCCGGQITELHENAVSYSIQNGCREEDNNSFSVWTYANISAAIITDVSTGTLKYYASVNASFIGPLHGIYVQSRQQRPPNNSCTNISTSFLGKTLYGDACVTIISSVFDFDQFSLNGNISISLI
jgi:hypothetical protein